MARWFSLAEANALIPRLSGDFEEVAAIRRKAGQARAELARLEARGRSNGNDLTSEIREIQNELEALQAKAQEIVENIVRLGCEIKDIDQGLVDFPSDRDGRTVYLCWKLGEDSIQFWHELSTGFAGRQPL